MTPRKPAGYSGTPLAKKLGLRANTRVVFVGAPDHFDDLLGPLPDGVTRLRRPGSGMDHVHVFARTSAELARRLPACVRALARDGALWISWPKKTSPLAADLTGTGVRAAGLGAGLVDVKVCAVDEDWSGHKFCYRREDR
ncbi:MAG: DUF3052 domain-containing protein [Planctomycetota bacterium]